MVTLTTTNVLFILIVHIVADKNEITKIPQLGVMIHTAVVLLILIGHVAAVNNGLARVPQLGWVSKHFRIIHDGMLSDPRAE